MSPSARTKHAKAPTIASHLSSPPAWAHNSRSAVFSAPKRLCQRLGSSAGPFTRPKHAII